MSVRRRIVGRFRVNCVICPGYHDGGTGSTGKGMFCNMAMIAVVVRYKLLSGFSCTCYYKSFAAVVNIRRRPS